MTKQPVHKTHLAIYLPTLVGGGAERVMLNLAGGFTQRGYAVDFVLAQCEGAFMPQFPPSVHLIELNSRMLRFGRSLYSIPALVRYLRQAKPDALLTGLHANIISIWAKKLSGVPVRLAIAEHNTFSQRNQTLPFPIKQLFPWLIRWNYPRADRIIAVSHGSADDLAVVAHLPRDRIDVIYNPIITPEMITKAKMPLNHPWFQPGEPPVILSIGRLNPQKDYPLLMQSFAGLRKSLPSRLLILGDGPERSRLFALADQLGLGEDFSLPGFVENPYPYMSKAGAFVLSSRWEGLPTVLVEALYCGTRLISTDCPSGPREILKGGQFGRLVPMGDLQGLTNAIQESLSMPYQPAPEPSWLPYTMNAVLDQYARVLFDIEVISTKAKD